MSVHFDSHWLIEVAWISKDQAGNRTTWRPDHHKDPNWSGIDMSPVHQVWPKPSCEAQWKGEKTKHAEKEGMDRLEFTKRGQWRTEKSGGNWFWSHLQCPNNPHPPLPCLRDSWRWRRTLKDLIMFWGTWDTKMWSESQSFEEEVLQKGSSSQSTLERQAPSSVRSTLKHAKSIKEQIRRGWSTSGNTKTPSWAEVTTPIVM